MVFQTKKEKKKLKRWARENYLPGSFINPLWDMEVQDECMIMNVEKLKGEYDTFIEDLSPLSDEWIDTMAKVEIEEL